MVQQAELLLHPLFGGLLSLRKQSTLQPAGFSVHGPGGVRCFWEAVGGCRAAQGDAEVVFRAVTQGAAAAWRGRRSELRQKQCVQSADARTQLR